MGRNCWEAKKCGREPAGARSKDLGVCPAAIADRATGLNGGAYGGRACWAISGTLCGGKVQGTFASKMVNCMECDFYVSVRHEEGADFQPAQKILEVLAGGRR